MKKIGLYICLTTSLISFSVAGASDIDSNSEQNIPVVALTKPDNHIPVAPVASSLLSDPNFNSSSASIHTGVPLLDKQTEDHLMHSGNVDVSKQKNIFLHHHDKDGKDIKSKVHGTEKVYGIVKPLDGGKGAMNFFNMGGMGGVSPINNANTGNFNLGVGVSGVKLPEEPTDMTNKTPETSSTLPPVSDSKGFSPSDCTSGDLDKMLAPQCLERINGGKKNTYKPSGIQYQNLPDVQSPIQRDNVKCSVMVQNSHTVDHFNSSSVVDCLKTAIGEGEGMSGITNIAIESGNDVVVVSCNRENDNSSPACHSVNR